MKKALLDTNFILTCLKQKIDFFDEFFLMGIKALIPLEVIEEIKSLRDKIPYANLALDLLKINDFEEISLGKGKVDDLIVNYAKKNPKVIIATLDKEIKNKLKNPKLVVRNQKKIEIL